MKKFLNSKIILTVFAIIGMICGSFLFNLPANKVYANTIESDGIVFTSKVVERTKIEITDESKKNNSNIFGAEVTTTDTSTTPATKTTALANGKEIDTSSISGTDLANVYYYDVNSYQEYNYSLANNANPSGEKEYYVQNIALNKHTMLKNDLNSTVQNAYISFGWDNIKKGTEAYIYELTVGLTLTHLGGDYDGETHMLYTRDIEGVSENNKVKKYYQHYLDLNYNETSAGEQLVGYQNNQGVYTFTFTYRTISGTNVSASNTVSYSFTLLRQKHYSSDYDTSVTGEFGIVGQGAKNYKTYKYDQSENNSISPLNLSKYFVYSPVIKNINPYFQVFDTQEDQQEINSNDNVYGLSNKLKYNTFFNYADRTAMPTLTFDASKYTVKVSRSYYSSNAEFMLGNGVTTLNNAKECGVIVTNNQNQVTIEFVDLGVYTISYEYVFFGTVMTAENSQRMLICGEQLNVFGTQIFYAKDTIGEAEMFDTVSGAGAYLINDNYSSNNLPTIPYNLVSTNQAPVWVGSLGIIKSTSNYYKWNGTGWDKNNYINGTKFADSGIYLLEINYTYADWTSVIEKNIATTYSNEAQWFCFKIENKTPTLSVKASDKEVSSLTQVNSDVNVTVSGSKGVFDSDVKLEIAECVGTNTSGNKEYATILTYNGYSEIASQNITLGEEKEYRVRLYYGATIGGVQSTYTERIFAIDKTAPTLKLNSDTLNDYVNILSGSFAVTCTDSDLKSLTYAYATFDNNGEVELKGNYLFNGHTLSAFTAEIDYVSGTNISVMGVYVFFTTDNAGNLNRKIIVLDQTKPLFLQTPEQANNNPYNVFSEAVTVSSGSYKAIKLNENTANLSSLLATILTPDEEISFNKYFDIDNKAYKVELNSEETAIECSNEQNEAVTENSISGLFNSKQLAVPAEDNVYYFDITVKDLIGNEFTKRIEINMDRSQGYILSNSEIYGTNNNGKTFRVYNNTSTNLKSVQFEFVLGEEEYEVISLTYSYYPFSYKQDGSNYPFTETPAIENKDILLTISQSPLTSTKHITQTINPVYSNKYNSSGENITAEGYYVITRCFNQLDENNNYKSKTYSFVVDRNNIKADVSYDQDNNETYDWGENIYFNLNNEGKTYTSFISNISNNPQVTPTSLLISTNKLPAYLNIPKYKYDAKTENNFLSNALSVKGEVGLSYTEGNSTKIKFVTLFEISNKEITYYNYANRDLTIEPSSQHATLHTCKVNESIEYNNVTYSFEDFRNYCLTFISAGTYKVYISDSTSNSYKDHSNTEYKTFANTLSFQFEIKHSAPTGWWHTSTNSYYSSIAILNAEDNYVNFSFSNYNDITKAEIDINNIQLVQIYKNVEKQITVNASDLYIMPDNFSTTYTIRGIDTSDEYIYALTISYKGEEDNYKVDNNNYFKKTYYLIVDKLKPTYTIQNMVNGDAYKNKNSYVSLNEKGEYELSEEYFFVVDSNYTFNQCSDNYVLNKYSYFENNTDVLNALKNTETNLMYYYREYDKFKAGESNMSSLLPDDPNYENYNVQRDRPRFNIYSTDYKSMQYNTNLKDLKPNRFYEIIEVDGANNYSSFTIYLSDSKAVKVNYNNGITIERPYISPVDETINFSYTDNLSNLVINSIAFASTDENKYNNFINDMFFSVEVKIGSNSKLFNFTNNDFILTYDSTGNVNYSVNENLTLASINKFIQTDLATESVIINGTEIQVKIYSRYATESLTDELVYTYKIQGTKKLQLSYNLNNKGQIVIVVPAQTASTYIESFKIMEVVDGELTNTVIYNTLLTEHALGFIYNTNTTIPFSNSMLNPEKVYLVEYKDNFDFTQVLIINLMYEDVSSEDRLQYNRSKSTTIKGVINTSDAVTFTYQSYLYSIYVTKNGEEYTNYTVSKNQETGKVTLTFNPANNFTSKDEYSISVYPIVQTETSAINYSFIISTVLPNVQIKDFLDNILFDANASTAELNTAQRIFLNWDSYVTDYNPTLSISTPTGAYNESSLSNGKSYFNTIGKYTITQTNDIGTTRKIVFYIIEDTNKFYWVEKVSNKQLLTPSSERYAYEEELITFYNTTLSKDEYNVIANIDKGLTSEWFTSFEENGVTINIFKIYGTTTHVYEEYVAIATLASTNSILTNSAFKINGASSSANPYSTYGVDGKITLTWNSYHLLSCNPITAYISYNNGTFKQLTNFQTNTEGTINTVTLSVGGEYKFQFIDNAGNIHVFNDGTVNKSNYLTINLINNVWVRVKGETETEYRSAINYEVFNTSVMVEIYGTKFIKNGTLTYSVLRNGKEITVAQTGNRLNFTTYGFYAVTFNAKENVSGNENDIETTLYFTIIDKNETRSIFDYSTANFQSITKVEKLVGDYYIDITTELLELYEVSSLNHVFISTFSVGAGKYNIYIEDTSNADLTNTSKFMFSVWVNDETPALIMNRAFGTSATSKVKIRINPALIYSQLGNCKLVISNYGTIVINEESTNNIQDIVLDSVAEYYVSIVSSSGKVLFSNKITVTESLNSVAIIVIVVIIAVIIIGIIVFLKLRTGMRIR